MPITAVSAEKALVAHDLMAEVIVAPPDLFFQITATDEELSRGDMQSWGTGHLTRSTSQIYYLICLPMDALCSSGKRQPNSGRGAITLY